MSSAEEGSLGDLYSCCCCCCCCTVKPNDWHLSSHTHTLTLSAAATPHRSTGSARHTQAYKWAPRLYAHIHHTEEHRNIKRLPMSSIQTVKARGNPHHPSPSLRRSHLPLLVFFSSSSLPLHSLSSSPSYLSLSRSRGVPPVQLSLAVSLCLCSLHPSLSLSALHQSLHGSFKSTNLFTDQWTASEASPAASTSPSFVRACMCVCLCVRFAARRGGFQPTHHSPELSASTLPHQLTTLHPYASIACMCVCTPTHSRTIKSLHFSVT